MESDERSEIKNVPNSQRISCLDSSLVPACDAGEPGSIPGGGKLTVMFDLRGALLKDRDVPDQVKESKFTKNGRMSNLLL